MYIRNYLLRNIKQLELHLLLINFKLISEIN